MAGVGPEPRNLCARFLLEDSSRESPRCGSDGSGGYPPVRWNLAAGRQTLRLLHRSSERGLSSALGTVWLLGLAHVSHPGTILHEMEPDFTKLLEEATSRILSSASRKKLVVAGPGTGKTYLFRKLLEQAHDGSRNKLALTFINNLKDDLAKDLSDLAQVFTFHGYCNFLLRRNESLRTGLTEHFHYYPALPSLVKRDYEIAHDVGAAPQFVLAMQRLEIGTETDFYIDRSNYYNAIGFDDSVYRVFRRLDEHPGHLPRYDLVVVDEFQDFNALEAALIDVLAAHNPIVIAGDDDQALYAQLRGSSHEFIRGLHRRGDYACFELPFCMRSPEVVIQAFDDVLQNAKKLGNLDGRIEKPYRYYPPHKANDTKQYPRIRVFETSVQSLKANYIGRIIETLLTNIPATEIRESHEKHFPTVLVIGPTHFLRQISTHLEAKGWAASIRKDETVKVRREDGLRILSEENRSNLGWRIVLDTDGPQVLQNTVTRSVSDKTPLVDLLPSDYKEKVLQEANALEETHSTEESEGTAEAAPDPGMPTIRLTSYEGSNPRLSEVREEIVSRS